ncbi:MAG: hypothetical protein M0Z36_02630, partial [Thermaerobacter sp.]|nr:hypothetical protein [Thermaerobacter sp.]
INQVAFTRLQRHPERLGWSAFGWSLTANVRCITIVVRTLRVRKSRRKGEAAVRLGLAPEGSAP